MNVSKMYKRHRFPAEIIQYTVWLYYRFNLSHRDIKDLLAERGVIVSYEAIRLWCNKFGPKFADKLKRKHQGFGDTFFIDEVFVRIGGVQRYLWRAVVESFFGSLKQERVQWQNYQTRYEAQQDILKYISTWFNPYRLHSTLGYVSPNYYERQFNELKRVA